MSMFEFISSFFQFDPWIYVLGFFVASAAGFVDAIAGGGGLIALPFLVGTGMHPAAALGTNKMQACFGTSTAMLNYRRKKLLDSSQVYIGVIFTLIGAVLGAQTASALSSEILNLLIPILLLLIVLYFAFKRNFEPKKALLPRGVFYVLFGLLLGFYDGFFGPGAGSFWTTALIGVSGLSLVQAVGDTKIFNFTSNFTAFAVFAFNGLVMYDLAIFMCVGQILGAYTGSSFAARKGLKVIKPLIITVSSIISIKLLYNFFTS